ncbi:response regulator [Rossellomorea vietnamensis]|uniref:Response regulator n=2 Tax=Rossellomorea TaxID=2837508 RepID=A0A5D4K947_9BACI|nr:MULTISPECIES: response regulator [Rossellomorea]TYR73546.1 response regulator [Rossellomorea vietnamensis]TYS75523.1 response regulator [Rossellomorea aquimaris]
MLKTILIVDDEPRSRQGLMKSLEKWADGQYNILTASNGQEAIELMKSSRVHILLTDIRMPEITGLQLVKMIKEQEVHPVIIVISAYSEFEYAQEALRSGVINYLLKPISKKALIEAVEAAVQAVEKQVRAETIEKVVDKKLVQADSQNLSTSTPIREAVEYINKHLKNELTQKEVADHVHLNPSYLSVLFKEHVRMTFSEYVTRRRIQRGKDLLISTKLPINEIAEESGYKTAKYFIKIFKEQEGMTPSAYRKIHNETAF